MMREEFSQVEKLVKKSENILLICHKKPDGDTIGSAVAISLFLKGSGKKAYIACVDDVSHRFSFLSEVKTFIKEFDYLSYDLIFVLDAGASYVTKYDQIYPGIYSGEVPVVNIDHHMSNDNFGTINIVDIQSASTSVLVFKMFKFWNVQITPNMATALLTGIYNDTGSLMHQNTTLEVFEVCSELALLGAKVRLVSKNLFKNSLLSTLKAWGKAMENLQLNSEGVAISVVTENELKQIGAQSDDLSGVIDFLNSIPEAAFTVLLNEDEKGNVKGSFRTRKEGVDLAELAEKFGGGGHKKASGFTMQGRLHREIRWKVLPAREDSVLNSPLQTKQIEPFSMVKDTIEIPCKSIDKTSI